MTEERLAGIDQATLLTERMLGNRKTLRVLIAGGQEKKVILQQVISELGNDPVGQACFLRTLFRNMAIEGAQEITNRRDGAFAILTDQAMQPMMEAIPSVLYDSYIEVIRHQTVQNDPVSGSIDALLEAGKAIAPHLPSGSHARQQITDAWEAVAGQFPTIDDRLHIRSKIKEIKQRMSSTGVLDTQVEKLRMQGLTNAQIAKQLERKQAYIEASARRLIAAGRIKPSKKGPKPKALTP